MQQILSYQLYNVLYDITPVVRRCTVDIILFERSGFTGSSSGNRHRRLEDVVLAYGTVMCSFFYWSSCMRMDYITATFVLGAKIPERFNWPPGMCYVN